MRICGAISSAARSLAGPDKSCVGAESPRGLVAGWVQAASHQRDRCKLVWLTTKEGAFTFFTYLQRHLLSASRAAILQSDISINQRIDPARLQR